MQLLAAIERDLQKKREPVAAGSRKEIKTMKYFNTVFDDTIPEWQEIGNQIFFAGLAGFVLSIVLYLVVAL